MKHFITLYFFFFSTMFLLSCNTDNNNEILTTDSVTSMMKAVNPSDLIGQAKQEIVRINKIDGKHFASFNSIIMEAKEFGKVSAYMHYKQEDFPDSVKNFLKKERDFIIDKQVQTFPLLRKAYIDSVAKASLKDGITITLSGTKIKVVGSIYASEKIIQNTQNSIGGELEDLRFKGITYRINKDDREFTYFPIASKKDNELNY